MFVKKTPFLKGVLKAPPSKSYTHRAIVIAALDNNTRIINPLFCDDTMATVGLMKKLGAGIVKARHKGVSCLDIRGFNGKPRLGNEEFNAGESGTLLRIVLPLIALSKGKHTVSGRGTLRERPNAPIVEALRSWGINIHGRGKGHKLPITLDSAGFIRGGEIAVSGRISSQTISSLLIASSLAREDTAIIIKDKLVSRPYVDITIDVLRWAGIEVKNKDYRVFKIKPRLSLKTKGDFVVHGDYSSAAFLLAGACLVPSDVTLTDLIEDEQGDRAIIGILEKMGAVIKRGRDSLKVKGPFELRGADIDCRDTPDLVPILAVLGCFAKGVTRLYNIEHLIYKESDRIAMPALELSKLGAHINFTRKELLIKHSVLQGGVVCPHNDHRLAMALAVAGLKAGGITIQNASCVSKSYPTFFSDMRKLGAKL
jgi:3-phosphoshikimate 1-carboxyvinyltransferase